MVESYVQLPQDSVGKKLRSIKRTVEGVLVEEQVVRLECHQKAELPAYAVSVLDSAVAASKHHLSLWNASGSNKWLEVLKVVVSNSSGVLGLRLYRASSISGGTNQTVGKLNTGNADLPSQITAPAGATVTNVAALSAAVITAGVGLALFDEKETGQPLLLKEGEGVSIQQYATAGAGTVDAAIIFRIVPKE